MVDIEGLKKFVAISRANRDFSLYFSGREDVLADLVDRANIAKIILEDKHITPAGLTTIVQGCPGIGKTSLMHRFVQLCDEDFENNRRNGKMPLPFILGLSEAISTSTIMDRALSPDPSNLAMRWIKGLGKDLMDRLKLTTTFENFLNALSRGIGGKPIVVLVDEIQNADEQNRQFLADLHNGIGFGENAVLPVYFGLNSASSNLETLGLSRLGDDSIVDLGLLSLEECKHSFSAMLDEHGIDNNELTEEWVDLLVSDTQGFPHHLTLALRATASVLARDDGRMTQQGLEDARNQADNSRIEFYRARVGLVESLPEEAVGAVARSLQEDPFILGRHPAKASEVMFKILEELENPPSSIADAQEMLHAMVHRGILQLDSTRQTYTIPIPSFQTWAVENLPPNKPRFQ